ncbi:unnamed protein product [Brassica oleracea]
MLLLVVSLRFFQSLFPQEPNFRGRRVVTFHNQRDFIFFRHHRYILDIKKDKKSGAKGKKGVAKERVKDARLELVWVSRALLIDPTLLDVKRNYVRHVADNSTADFSPNPKNRLESRN